MRPQLILILGLLVLIVKSTEAGILYSPQYEKKDAHKLVVVFHGCLQSAQDMYDHSGWNQLADKYGFSVYYPQVPAFSHPMDCWSWYLPMYQNAFAGGLPILNSEIEAVSLSLGYRNSQVFLVGMSSGAAMVANLAACFPTAYSAIALHSGLSYGLAQDPWSAREILKKGPPEKIENRFCDPQKFRGDLFVIHGLLDGVVNPTHAKFTVQDFMSAKEQKREKKTHKDYEYEILKYQKASQRGQVVYVKDLGHQWSGAAPRKNNKNKEGFRFFTEIGPNATEMMWSFFDQKQ